MKTLFYFSFLVFTNLNTYSDISISYYFFFKQHSHKKINRNIFRIIVVIKTLFENTFNFYSNGLIIIFEYLSKRS